MSAGRERGERGGVAPERASAAWLEVVRPIAREAGLLLRRRLQERRLPPARKKASGGWVTDLDYEAEELIIRRLRRYFPEHGMLGEESGLEGDAARCWVIDPLDGTTNFIHGYPQCAVSIAYCEGGRARVGAVYDIGADDLYSAAAGAGAFVNDERIRVSGCASLSKAVFIFGGPSRASLMPHIADLSARCDGFRRLGATALDLAWLAAGRADALVSGPVHFWDVAAGALLLREAGGLLSDVNDKTEFAFNEKTAVFVAGAPRVFSRFFGETKRFCARAGL